MCLIIFINQCIASCKDSDRNGAYVCQIHLIFKIFTHRECTDGYESLPFIEPMMELKIFLWFEALKWCLGAFCRACIQFPSCLGRRERHFTDYSLKSKSGFSLDRGLRMSRNIPDHYPSAAVKLIFVVGNLCPRLDCSHSVLVE